MSKKMKVMVVKMEVVNGKKMGKSLALNLDAEDMAQYSTEATMKKKVLEKVADSRVFGPEDLKELKFEMKDFMKEWRLEVKKREEERMKKMKRVEMSENK